MTKRYSRARMAAVFCFTLLGSLSAHSRPVDPITQQEMLTRLGEMQHVPWAGKAVETDDGDFGSCNQSVATLTVGDPMTATTRPLAVTVIRPPASAPVPVVILVPTVEGVTFIEKKYASHLCDAGIATIIADVNETAIPTVLPAWGNEDLASRRAVLSLRTVIDYASTSSEFDSKRVGLMGLSLGAIASSYLAGIESSRLNAIVLVLAGGDVPFILATSDNKYAVRLREGRMEKENMTTVDQYEEKLHQTMRYDPLYFAGLAKTDHIFMVMSDNDTKVPSSVQQDLFAAYGKPSSTMFSLSHVETIASVAYWYFDYVGDFLKARFSVKPQLMPHLYHLKVPVQNLPTMPGLSELE